ncbi:Sigma factor binding protein 1- chloroplastic [Striga hermonthica]|uniref:Sigma factor binding protein 1- chloroplastic n=1 Tax=Striga hermonthica TaxID=68872 RepID=A0A9N7NXG5_STRHE|nr:Sigma factor binding protein 1- chloroplastic [Striga hermonthica]
MNLDQNKNNHKGKRKSSKATNNSLKVVYISSPMKVATSASRFKSLVQELTGKNSDISRYMDNDSNYAGGGDFREIDFSRSHEKESSEEYRRLSSSVTPENTPTTSDSVLETRAMDSGLVSQMNDQFEDIFSVNEFDYDTVGMDICSWEF